MATAMFGPPSGVSADLASDAEGATAASGRGASSLHETTRVSARTPAAAARWCDRMGEGLRLERDDTRPAHRTIRRPDSEPHPLFSGRAVSERSRALRTGLAAGVPFS